MGDRHFAFWPEGVPRTLDVPALRIHDNLSATALRVPEATAIAYYGTRRQLPVARRSGRSPRRLPAARARRRARRPRAAPDAEQPAIRDRLLCDPQGGCGGRAAQSDAGSRGSSGRIVAGAGRARRPVRRAATRAGRGADRRAARFGPAVVASYGDVLDEQRSARGRPASGRGLRRDRVCPIEGPGLHDWGGALAAGAEPKLSIASADDLAVIVYTSGSTGEPRGCMHTHRTVQANIQAYAHWAPMDETSVSCSARCRSSTSPACRSCHARDDPCRRLQRHHDALGRRDRTGVDRARAASPIGASSPP